MNQLTKEAPEGMPSYFTQINVVNGHVKERKKGKLTGKMRNLITVQNGGFVRFV